MTRILLVYDGMMSTVELLEAFLRESAGDRDYSLQSKFSHLVTEEDILDCDVVICVRGNSPIMHEVLTKARGAGRFVVFYIDDDLQHMPKNVLYFPIRTKYLLKCLKCAEFLLTPSRLLLEEYLPLISGTRGAVMHWSVNETQIQPRFAKGDGAVVQIVYAGTKAHGSNWDKFIAPIWSNITQKYGNQISMTFVGLCPQVPADNFGTTVEYIPSMKLAEYRQFMYSNRFDIGLSPLITNHFSARKSFVKYLEYSQCGICGIYSNCPPYSLIVQDGENGILAENTPQAWQCALERAIENKVLREQCVDNAQRQLRESFSKEAIKRQLRLDLPELMQFQAPNDAVIKLSSLAKRTHMAFRFFERMYLTVLSFHLNGVGWTVQRIKSKFK